MTVFLLILLFLLINYIGFIIVPAALIYRFAFGRKPCGAPLTERELEGTRYAPYAAELVPADRFVHELPYEAVSVTARDGVILCGRYISQGASKTMICVHGYAGAPISNLCVQAEHFYRQGWNLLFIVQRAHGDSGGKRLGLGLLEQYDLLEWIALASGYEGVRDIVLYGSSMGSSAIGYASDKITDPKVRALVLDCAFSSPYSQLERDSRMRGLPTPLLLPVLRLFARIDFHEDLRRPVGKSLAHTAIPVLFLHGEADKTVPIERGIENYEYCASQKEFISVPNAEHILAYVTGGEEVMRRTDEFITQALKGNAP